MVSSNCWLPLPFLGLRRAPGTVSGSWRAGVEGAEPQPKAVHPPSLPGVPRVQGVREGTATPQAAGQRSRLPGMAA